MKIRLRKLDEQVVIITGATSGVGLVTARKAAQRGARLVLAARNAAALDSLQREFADKGVAVATVTADVGRRVDVEYIAQVALQRFGAFDTWINNAGVTIFGRLEDVPDDDHERLFLTNFWGTVHGALVARAHLAARGGAIINVGSESGDRAVALQGMYSAAKHAVKGFTDALRQECEAAGLQIAVTLIKPAALDTMLAVHARNYLGVEPRLTPPVYAPDLAADAILFAAENPSRDLYVGAAAKAISTGAFLAPRLLDKYMERFMLRQQQSVRAAVHPRRDALYGSTLALREREGMGERVHEHSVYTEARLHPRATVLVLTCAAAILGALWFGGTGRASMLKSGHD